MSPENLVIRKHQVLIIAKLVPELSSFSFLPVPVGLITQQDEVTVVLVTRQQDGYSGCCPLVAVHCYPCTFFSCLSWRYTDLDISPSTKKTQQACVFGETGYLTWSLNHLSRWWEGTFATWDHQLKIKLTKAWSAYRKAGYMQEAYPNRPAVSSVCSEWGMLMFNKATEFMITPPGE